MTAVHDHPSARTEFPHPRSSLHLRDGVNGLPHGPKVQRADGLLSTARARLVLVAFLASFVLAFAWTAERWSAGGALVTILAGFLLVVSLLPKEDE